MTEERKVTIEETPAEPEKVEVTIEDEDDNTDNEEKDE